MNTKKTIAALSLLAVLVTATPAFASAHNSGNDEGKDKGFSWGQMFKGFHNSRFTVTGTVQSIVSGSIVLSSAQANNVPNVSNGTVTIKTDANTKVATSSDHKTALTLADVVVGQKITATGSLSGTDALVKNIKIINSGVVAGKVTAKTDTSVTITNAVTGVTKTINTDADTKVNIDGETKAVADIQVGDSGWIKFKTVTSNLVAKFIGLFR